MTTRAGNPTPSNRGDNVAVADVAGWYRTYMTTHKLHILELLNNLTTELAIFVETWTFRPEYGGPEERIREVDEFYVDVISNTNRFFDIIADNGPVPGREDGAEPVYPTERLEKAVFRLANPISGSKPHRTSRQERGSEFATQSSQSQAVITRPPSINRASTDSVAGPSGTKHGTECSCPACRHAEIIDFEADSEDPIYGNAQVQQTEAAASRSKVGMQSENPQHELLVKASEPLNLPTLRPRSRRLEKLKKEERQPGKDSGLRNPRTKERSAATSTELRESTPEESNRKGKNFKSKDVAIGSTQGATGKTSTKATPNDELIEQQKPKRGSGASSKTKRPLEEGEEKGLIPVPEKRQSKRQKMT